MFHLTSDNTAGRLAYLDVSVQPVCIQQVVISLSKNNAVLAAIYFLTSFIKS